ncbi:helix-turn-helix domain-containing protein [Streptomonospora sp. PA3]|uniref:helix-turn-helix domain-containing protein n=1 Tax=Streptomonospora sp. PA3 TaxID=2607326 RepID=UPI0012DC62A0|nr:helix-turn-helix transcriptional regulator [Streptomonospora sp. PA3]MUL44244.1 helix-turn-helix domain-containing protein [Streptomonospora sp. PA3]
MWEEFGRYLRDQRSQAGLTLNQAASAIGQSASLLGKLERGERVCQRPTARALEDLYGTNGTLLDRWTRTQARSSDPTWSRQATECEARAANIKQFNAMVLPGILQIPAYAGVLFEDGRPGEDMRSVVAARCSRLAALSASLEYVIPHHVLKTAVGGAETMADQLSHVLELIDSGRIRVQILPDDAGTRAGLAGHFRLFSFHDRLPMAYAEHVSGGVLIDDMAEVHRLGALWGTLSAFAYDPSHSCALIKEAEREYRVD